MQPKIFLAPLLLTFGSAFASDQPGASSTGSLFQVLMVLVLVLGLMLAAAWLLKKFNATGTNVGSSIKIISGVAVGSRERIMVIEVADQWIVIGVTANNISALTSMPKQEIASSPEAQTISENFANRLKQFIEKRNAK